MKTNIQFQQLTSLEAIAPLKQEWLASLSSPQDGMWETFRDDAQHWGIKVEEILIGYACIDEEAQLIQFYLIPQYLDQGRSIFLNLLKHTEVKKCIVGTNNPIFLSLALDFAKKVEVHSYLFRASVQESIQVKEGFIRKCKAEDHEKIVHFYLASIDASKEWLHTYVGERIDKGEIYYLEHEKDIIGTCEVRKSSSNPRVADIGMAIAPNYRKQGYGSFLLYNAKLIAQKSGRMAICSCEKENVGSFKAINKAGFRSLHQLLEIEFGE